MLIAVFITEMVILHKYVYLLLLFIISGERDAVMFAASKILEQHLSSRGKHNLLVMI